MEPPALYIGGTHTQVEYPVVMTCKKFFSCFFLGVAMKHIAVVSASPRLGKTTIARAIACQLASQGQIIKIADLDHRQEELMRQASAVSWSCCRLREKHLPPVRVEGFADTHQALKQCMADSSLDVLVTDGIASDDDLIIIMEYAELVVIVTNDRAKDIKESIALANELAGSDPQSKQRIVFALCRTGKDKQALSKARTQLKDSGYLIADGQLPDLTDYHDSMQQGLAVTESQQPKAKEQAVEVIDWLITKAMAAAG